MHPLSHYEHLAKLFDYPRWDYPRWVQAAYDLLAGRHVLAAAEVAAFAQELPTDGEAFTPEALDEVQEIFTRTFEVQAATTLDVGYVMFGDDYKRGEMLVNLSREQRAAGVRGFVSDLLPLFADGRIRPIIDRVYAFDELPEAKAYMESNAHLGKIVVRVG